MNDTGERAGERITAHVHPVFLYLDCVITTYPMVLIYMSVSTRRGVYILEYTVLVLLSIPRTHVLQTIRMRTAYL